MAPPVLADARTSPLWDTLRGESSIWGANLHVLNEVYIGFTFTVIACCWIFIICILLGVVREIRQSNRQRNTLEKDLAHIQRLSINIEMKMVFTSESYPHTWQVDEFDCRSGDECERIYRVNTSWSI